MEVRQIGANSETAGDGAKHDTSLGMIDAKLMGRCKLFWWTFSKNS